MLTARIKCCIPSFTVNALRDRTSKYFNILAVQIITVEVAPGITSPDRAAAAVGNIFSEDHRKTEFLLFVGFKNMSAEKKVFFINKVTVEEICEFDRCLNSVRNGKEFCARRKTFEHQSLQFIRCCVAKIGVIFTSAFVVPAEAGGINEIENNSVSPHGFKITAPPV